MFSQQFLVILALGALWLLPVAVALLLFPRTAHKRFSAPGLRLSVSGRVLFLAWPLIAIAACLAAALLVIAASNSAQMRRQP